MKFDIFYQETSEVEFKYQFGLSLENESWNSKEEIKEALNDRLNFIHFQIKELKCQN